MARALGAPVQGRHSTRSLRSCPHGARRPPVGVVHIGRHVRRFGGGAARRAGGAARVPPARRPPAARRPGRHPRSVRGSAPAAGDAPRRAARARGWGRRDPPRVAPRTGAGYAAAARPIVVHGAGGGGRPTGDVRRGCRPGRRWRDERRDRQHAPRAAPAPGGRGAHGPPAADTPPPSRRRPRRRRRRVRRAVRPRQADRGSARAAARRRELPPRRCLPGHAVHPLPHDPQRRGDDDARSPVLVRPLRLVGGTRPAAAAVAILRDLRPRSAAAAAVRHAAGHLAVVRRWGDEAREDRRGDRRRAVVRRPVRVHPRLPPRPGGRELRPLLQVRATPLPGGGDGSARRGRRDRGHGGLAGRPGTRGDAAAVARPRTAADEERDRPARLPRRPRLRLPGLGPALGAGRAAAPRSAARCGVCHAADGFRARSFRVIPPADGPRPRGRPAGPACRTGSGRPLPGTPRGA